MPLNKPSSSLIPPAPNQSLPFCSYNEAFQVPSRLIFLELDCQFCNYFNT